MALVIEASVLLTAAGAAVRWVNKPAQRTAEQVPAAEPTGPLLEQPA
ncbi:hypothetical protein [Saccharopolyspora sp. MS10]